MGFGAGDKAKQETFTQREPTGVLRTAEKKCASQGQFSVILKNLLLFN